MSGVGMFMEMCRRGLVSKGKNRVYVFGNEAGDVDSIVSAVGMAYWWKVGLSKEESDVLVPFCGFNRREFRLRGDARLLFKQAGFGFDSMGAPPDLLFLDDLSFPMEDANIVLTDHNVPSSEMASRFPNSTVIGIVDHHKDQKQFCSSTKVRLIDESCGSTCTLVAHEFIKGNQDIPGDLLKLLVGGILLDTRNFNTDNKRFNETDVTVYNELCEKYKLDKTSHADWFKQLKQARLDVEGLTAGDLLRLDFKSVNVDGKRMFGFSSIMDSWPGLVAKGKDVEELKQEMQSFMKERGLDALICLAKACQVQGNDTKRKGLVIISEDDSLGHQVITHLSNVPSNLSSDLQQHPLIQSQEIAQKGFHVQTYPDYATSGMHITHIRAEVTRKTLIPTVVDMFQK